MSYTLSTTLVITRRSTAGTAPLWANAARPPTRSVPATANVPVATAPSFKNSRRFMALSLGWGLLAEERLRLAELGALRVGLLAERQELGVRSEEHTSELQSLAYLVCRLLLEKKKRHR